MAPRITTITDEQRAQLAPYAQAWIERVLTCGPADRAKVEDGIRRCYEAASIPWHGHVVWVASPLTACVAGPVAANILDSAGAVDDAVHDAVRGAVRDAVRGAVRGAVDDAVGGAVGGAVDVAVDVAVGGAVDVAVDVAVDGAVRGAVDVAVGAVGGAVGGAVYDAVGVAVGRWHRYMSSWWSWDAWRAACVEILGVSEVQHLVDALRDANGAGWWWPHRQFVIIADRPTELHRERIGPDGWGSHQLHNPHGPSIAWGDEWRLHHWHGTRVPEWVITDPTPERIHAEPNTEIRRCAIENYGWDRYLAHIGVQPVDTADDPGNPGHTLELYALPAEHQPYNEPVAMLVMRNASLDRDGTRRTFAETVPATIRSAVDAAAWQFDIDPQVYRQLERAT